MDIWGNGRCILFKHLFYLLSHICRGRPLKNVWRCFIQPSPLLCMKRYFLCLRRPLSAKKTNKQTKKYPKHFQIHMLCLIDTGIFALWMPVAHQSLKIFKQAVFNFLGSLTSSNDINLFISSFLTSFALQCKPLNIDWLKKNKFVLLAVWLKCSVTGEQGYREKDDLIYCRQEAELISLLQGCHYRVWLELYKYTKEDFFLVEIEKCVWKGEK